MADINKENQNKLSHEELKRLLHYNPETGIFTWLNTRGSVKAGKKAGRTHRGRNYQRIRINGVIYQSHRLAWLYMTGKWPENQIDHINGIKDDNRFHNLREATNSQNSFNKKARSDSGTGYKCVSWHRKSRKYAAYIRIKGRQVHLGTFDTPEEAHEAYKQKSLEIAGQFARWE